MLAISNGLDRACAIRHRLGGIGDVLLKFAGLRIRPGEAQFQTTCKIKRGCFGRATSLASGWPPGQTPPFVGTGFKRRDRRNIQRRSIILQVVIEKGLENSPAEVKAGIATEIEHS